MNYLNPILIVGLLIFIGHFFTAIFKKTNIPDVLPLIIVGILIGSPLTGLVNPASIENIGTVLGTIALALILFEGGSHLQFDTLLRSLKDCVKLSTITFIMTVLVSTFFLNIWFNDIILSMFAGIVLGSISPAVVVPIAKLLNITPETKTTLVVESAITDVLSIVFALSVINSLKIGATDLKDIFINQLLVALIMSFIFGFLGALLWSIILKKIRRFPNTIFTTLGFIFILYGLVEGFHYNGALTILVFGLVIANSKKIPLNILEFTNIEKTLFSEIIFIVKTFFFVYLGICLSEQFGQTSILITGFMLTVLLYLCRYVLTKILSSKDISKRERNLIAFMIPKGLAAAVLVQLLVDNAEIQKLEIFTTESLLDMRAMVYSVIFFSILLSTILIYFEESKHEDSIV